MITEIRLHDFKNFSEARLQVGDFTLIIGVNASGKSNVRDAFRFLHGIGRRFSLADIIGGRYGAGGQVEWAQMRGAAKEIIRFGSQSFMINVSFQSFQGHGLYSIMVGRSEQSRDRFRVLLEELMINRPVAKIA